jgi:hypothetical protein
VLLFSEEKRGGGKKLLKTLAQMVGGATYAQECHHLAASFKPYAIAKQFHNAGWLKS